MVAQMPEPKARIRDNEQKNHDHSSENQCDHTPIFWKVGVFNKKVRGEQPADDSDKTRKDQ